METLRLLRPVGRRSISSREGNAARGHSARLRNCKLNKNVAINDLLVELDNSEELTLDTGTAAWMTQNQSQWLDCKRGKCISDSCSEIAKVRIWYSQLNWFYLNDQVVPRILKIVCTCMKLIKLLHIISKIHHCGPGNFVSVQHKLKYKNVKKNLRNFVE